MSRVVAQTTPTRLFNDQLIGESLRNQNQFRLTVVQAKSLLTKRSMVRIYNGKEKTEKAYSQFSLFNQADAT